MRAFSFAQPSSLDDALELLARPGAMALAGGTDLTSLLKNQIVQPELLVSLADVESLRGVTRTDQMLSVGAMTTLDELIEALDGLGLDALVQSAREIRAPQMLSVGTVGGELCQRPRCWYFRSGFGLLATQGDRSLIPDGDNRYHAVLGAGPAYFVSPSSLAPALSALGVSVTLRSASGERRLAIDDFYVAPTREGESELALGAGELVSSIELALGEMQTSSYEVRPRSTLDWPLVTASVAVVVDGGGTISRAKVVLGHVAPRPWVDQVASDVLVGKKLDAASSVAAGAAAASGARPLSRNAYKVRLAQVAVKRALLKLVEADSREVA